MENWIMMLTNKVKKIMSKQTEHDGRFDAIDTALGNVDVQGVLDKIGNAEDSTTAGTVMAKANAIMQDMKKSSSASVNGDYQNRYTYIEGSTFTKNVNHTVFELAGSGKLFSLFLSLYMYVSNGSLDVNTTFVRYKITIDNEVAIYINIKLPYSNNALNAMFRMADFAKSITYNASSDTYLASNDFLFHESLNINCVPVDRSSEIQEFATSSSNLIYNFREYLEFKESIKVEAIYNSANSFPTGYPRFKFDISYMLDE